MKYRKFLIFLSGLLFCLDVRASSIDIQPQLFSPAIGQVVPADKQSAVATAVNAAVPSVSVQEMADICDAGFKESANRLDDAVRFVDMVLGAQSKYLAAVAECQRQNGRFVDGKCVGMDGYELVFANVCRNGQVCVLDFSSVVTNIKYAYPQYINGYAAQNGLQLTCLDGFDARNAKHYLRCSARGLPYEFEFERLDATDAEIAAALAALQPQANEEPAADGTAEGDAAESAKENVAAGTMCPATGNGLKSINDKTKVDDICTSSYIAMGRVFMRKNGTCSCRAEMCKSGLPAVAGKCCPGGQEYDTETKNAAR